MPKRLINLQPHFLTQPQEVPSMAPSPKSLTCTDGSPTAWKVIVLANLVFTTTSVAQYQKVSCGILGYLESGTQLFPTDPENVPGMCRATHQIRTHRPGLARSQQGQSTRPFRSSRKRLQHRIQADGVHKTKNLNYSKISATFSLVTCVCVCALLITWNAWLSLSLIRFQPIVLSQMLDATLPPRKTESSDHFNFDSGRMTDHAIRHRVQRSYLIVSDTESDQLRVPVIP